MHNSHYSTGIVRTWHAVVVLPARASGACDHAEMNASGTQLVRLALARIAGEKQATVQEHST